MVWVTVIDWTIAITSAATLIAVLWIDLVWGRDKDK